MSGHNLDIKFMQCWDDVGGCDCWVGGFWDPNTATQWWSGWHLPGPAGLAGLSGWSWPNPQWTLIGYELWAYFKKGDRLIEAFYSCPNPSTTPATQQQQEPSGHWHITLHPNGTVKTSEWSADLLVDEHLYPKGTSPPKGAGKGNKSKCKDGKEGKGQGGKKGKGKF